MKINKREVAKLLAGIAVNQTIVHWAFLLSSDLPIDFRFYTLTPTLNLFAVIFWPIATALLVRYAWGRK
jgi:hypothetical protein